MMSAEEARQAAKNAAAGRVAPIAAFERPADVLTARDISNAEKRKILERWKQDAIALQVAADENMAGGESTRLDEVVAALTALDKLEGA